LAKKLSGAVDIKGYGNDVNIILSDDANFADIETELVKRLETSNQFLSGVEVILDAGNRSLSLEECRRLKEILSDKFKLIISTVKSQSKDTQQVVKDMGWIVGGDEQKNIRHNGREENIKKDVRMLAGQDNNAILIEGTFRSGQGISHRGNIIIIGDVNPGAEVIATGDVIVIGNLRGVAHAGAGGDINAKIIALNLRPIQLRIAGYIGRSPDSNPKQDNIPEKAYIDDGKIVVQKLR
jgi:septum site-determining protein MinC